MPWKETCAMDQRVQFVGDWLSGEYTKSELCRYYGISRVTGDKWIARYTRLGIEGLQEQSRAPTHHPNAITAEVCAQIVECKLEHPSFGAQKVIDRLRQEAPKVRWPAVSTAGEILKRAGLVRARRARRRIPAHSQPLSHCQEANAVWSADFKGDFVLGDGQRCYPLTISDNHSRYLLHCRALARPTHAATQPWFVWVFREYGLPDAIRTDNGAPFVSQALGGLSRLSAWWVRLGIRPERIAPGRPDQNGRHERMHRSLKAAVVVPPAATLSAQQRRFNAFVHEYNTERSHQALGRRTPEAVYTASGVPYPLKLPPVVYPDGVTVRCVRHNGQIKWKGHLLYVSDVLAQQPVGLLEIDEGLWELRYSFHLLGLLDERTFTINPPSHWHGKGDSL